MMVAPLQQRLSKQRDASTLKSVEKPRLAVR